MQQMKAYNTVIIGGGAVGMSIALHLALRGLGKGTLVIERDSALTLNSAMRSAGGIRQQFSVRENINMSLYGAEFIKTAPALLRVDDDADDAVDFQFRPIGYMFLAANQAGDAVLRANHKTQVDCGVSWVDLLDKAMLSQRYPWLNTADLTSGSAGQWGAREGYFDPWSYVSAMRRKAVSLGVEFRQANVVAAGFDGTSRSITHLDTETVEPRTGKRATHRVSGGLYCNAAGAWSSTLVDMINNNSNASSSNSRRIATLPVEARKRCIFKVECQSPPHVAMPPPTAPLTVDPSGVYFRPEGTAPGHFICGVSPPESEDKPFPVTAGGDEDSREIENVTHELFDDVIWPTLADRVPAFETLRVRSSWAGFYEHNSFDHNAIIGLHPDTSNLLLCTGFSGHGLQQSPAAGRAVAELIEFGSFQTIDLRRFSFERIAAGSHVWETGIV